MDFFTIHVANMDRGPRNCSKPPLIYTLESTHSKIIIYKKYNHPILINSDDQNCWWNQTSSLNLDEHVWTASATVRKILSSPIKFATPDACSLSITTGPGFARTSCSSKHHKNFKFMNLIHKKLGLHCWSKLELTTWTDLFCRLLCRSSSAWIPLVSMSVTAARTKSQT